MKEYIAKAVDGKDLTQEEAKKAMEIMLSGEATQAQIAAFLTAMRMKGETLEELIGLASVLRDKAETITPKSENYVDLVGTGGDCTYTSIFQPHLRLWSQRQDFRLQSMATVPSPQNPVRVMC